MQLFRDAEAYKLIIIVISSSLDFDLYLVRPERDDIVLNPSREIADYGIKRNEPMV